ncbi:MAG: S46 family peptidase, partial [Bacteroidales bacterium]|nr:S46 family peptidase [Bacteroidales bacterium]
EDDFTFVFGYPGSTQQYIPACQIEHISEVVNPIRINFRDQRLDIIKRYIDSDDLVRLQYASKAAGIANGWKKWIGENKGIERTNVIPEKQAEEKAFTQWANDDLERKKQFGGIINAFNQLYADISPLEKEMVLMSESAFSVEILRYARSFSGLVNYCKFEEPSDEEINDEVELLKRGAARTFKNYHQALDREVFIAMISAYITNANPAYRPAELEIIDKKFNGNISDYADYVFENSIMASETSVNEFLDNFKRKKYKKILQDPAYSLATAFADKYNQDMRPTLRKYYAEDDSLQRIYMKGLMEFLPDKRFYPDANFTLRVTYGKVKGYQPRDAVTYKHFTTLEGIMEKENPDIYDYVVEDKLKDLYESKDYGRYADKDGSMHVCFTATNHTSGGNSGSPLLNDKGELLGINFDRCWEGTMSDIVYDPEQCRNISIDIRYCLFIIDKYAGAGHLVEEMTIIE